MNIQYFQTQEAKLQCLKDWSQIKRGNLTCQEQKRGMSDR
jgi:hypothetical protein